jgi:hypothetical protein
MDTFLLVLLIVVGALGLLGLGYWLAVVCKDDEQRALDTQRDVLDIEWAALEQARRTNEVFYQARDDLRRAEWEHWAAPRYGPDVIDGEWE